jgi:hypothetical protein
MIVFTLLSVKDVMLFLPAIAKCCVLGIDERHSEANLGVK